MPHEVIMPALGMSQDTGQIVAWHKAPGDVVAAGDLLLEVETDKSTMEVEADRDGFLAKLLAEAGQDVPVGNVIAVISTEKPRTPGTASAIQAGTAQTHVGTRGPATSLVSPVLPAEQPTIPPAPAKRILASPKAKRLAAERSLDLDRLVEVGVPQPYHAADLEVFERLPTAANVAPVTAHRSRRVTARVPAHPFAAFCDWIRTETGATPDRVSVMLGFAGASLRRAIRAESLIVATEILGEQQLYIDPDRHPIGSAVKAASDAGPPSVILRDLSKTALVEVELGTEDAPVLSITSDREDLIVTLECSADALSPQAALQLVAEFSGRLDEPLLQLL